MVSPALLVRTISEATGAPPATVTDIDRKLVKANLRTLGGRGLNAARMTPLDAGRLLTAILASPQSNAAAAAVERYAATCVDQTRSSETRFGAIGIDDLTSLSPDHSFVDGLVGLIASASHGALATLLTTLPADDRPRLEIYAFTQATRGRIRITGMPNGMTASLDYRPAAIGSQPPGRGDALPGDLEQSRRITERTLYRIAALLAEEGRDG